MKTNRRGFIAAVAAALFGRKLLTLNLNATDIGVNHGYWPSDWITIKGVKPWNPRTRQAIEDVQMIFSVVGVDGDTLRVHPPIIPSGQYQNCEFNGVGGSTVSATRVERYSLTRSSLAFGNARA